MSTTITRLFDSYADAQATISQLEMIGVPADDITLVASNSDGAHNHLPRRHPKVVDDAEAGAALGSVMGGAGGLLAGLGLLAIPGLGPVVAAGWLASTVFGAGVGAVALGTAGGVVGALVEAGERSDDADVYMEGVRRGGSLVSARIDTEKLGEARRAFSAHNAVSATERGKAYRDMGWRGFDAEAPAYTADQAVHERKRHVQAL